MCTWTELIESLQKPVGVASYAGVQDVSSDDVS